VLGKDVVAFEQAELVLEEGVVALRRSPARRLAIVLVGDLAASRRVSCRVRL